MIEIEKTSKELKERYPGCRVIVTEDGREMIAEISDGYAVAVIERSRAHFHRKTRETYLVLSGTLCITCAGRDQVLVKGESLAIEPGQIHFACSDGEPAWIEVKSVPPWSADDHFHWEDPAVPRSYDSPFLSSGDPSEHSRTFSRFVLPFAYTLLPIQTKEGLEKNTGPYYRAATGQDWIHAARREALSWSDGEARFTRDRRQYLTPETGDVLFSQAAWFALEPSRYGSSAPMPVGVSPDPGDAKRIVIKCPAIILFEAKNGGKDLLDHAPMRNGLLVFEASIAPNALVTLSEWIGFNELFRYWKSPFDRHRHMKHSSWGGLQKGDCLRAWKEANGLDAEDVYHSSWARSLEYPVEMNGRRYRLETGFGNEAEAGMGWLETYPDQRAYVWTAAIHRGIYGSGDPSFNERVCVIGQNRDSLPDCATPWLRLLNVDEPGENMMTDPITQFESEWGALRTYRRWAHYGCVFGFSAHSGAMLSGPCDDPPVWRHFREIYFDQALLLLYLRATIFRFSARLTLYSRDAADAGLERPSDDFLERFMALRWQFMLFTNLYQFPIISNQQQALEMYSMLRREMDVQELYDEVSSEIHGTHELLALVEGGKQGDTTTRLTVVATIGMILGLLLSFFGINVFFPDETGGGWRWSELRFLAIGLLLIALPSVMILRHAAGLDRLFRRLSVSTKSPAERSSNP